MTTQEKNRAETFDNIYRFHKWLIGSGSGSVWIFNKSFVNFVNNFLQVHSDIKTIVDIGCGDWQIAQHFDLKNKNYVGCDVSQVVLSKVKKKFSSPKIKFLLLDAVNENLPAGDLVIIKDVLMHLSNESVTKLLSKLRTYKYVIIQADIYASDFVNKDTVDGGFRPIDVSKEPFNFGCRLEETYTEGLYMLTSLTRRVLGLPYLKKGIFVRIR